MQFLNSNASEFDRVPNFSFRCLGWSPFVPTMTIRFLLPLPLLTIGALQVIRSPCLASVAPASEQ